MPNYTAISEYYLDFLKISDDSDIMVDDTTMYNYCESIINCDVIDYESALDRQNKLNTDFYSASEWLRRKHQYYLYVETRKPSDKSCSKSDKLLNKIFAY